MNIPALTRPQIHDPEGLQDFSDALKDYAPAVERAVAKLRRLPGDRATLAELFRAVHNIKGDAALCRVDTGVALIHPIETLLARLRGGDIALSDLLAETILLTIDRLELATQALLHSQSIGHLHLLELAQGLDDLAQLTGEPLNAGCAHLIEVVTGFQPAKRTTPNDTPPRPTAPPEDKNRDMAVFRRLALQLDARSPLFAGRSDRLVQLALDTNELAGHPLDAEQLEAAVLFHDVGMMFIGDELWLKSGTLTDADRVELREHPGYAADLLARMPGWAAATRMVAEHHEMPAGTGYPRALSGDDICLGAKLLAVIDAFEAVMLKQSHRGRSRSVLRAVAEINANPNQFAAEWMHPFNQVIRQILARG